jgi:hypothetical protein
MMAAMMTSIIVALQTRTICYLTAAHAARCTARHGVGSHAEPPTMECATPVTKKVALTMPVTVLAQVEVWTVRS